MAKKTPETIKPISLMETANGVFEEGLLAREDVIHRWIEKKCTEYFSYAITEDHRAIVLMIAGEKYFNER